MQVERITLRVSSRVTLVMNRTVAPCGSWKSPITAALVAQSEVSLSQLEFRGRDVYWLEGRPHEAGRVVVMRCTAEGIIDDVTPAGFNVRSRVHEYGGGAYFLHHNTVFFTNFSDQRLYRQNEGEGPKPLTPSPEMAAGSRYADGRVTPSGHLIVCVRETHREGREPVNEIVALPADGPGPPKPLVSGRDFYSFPRVSPNGDRIAWTVWDHPRMPWDGTELWVADLAAEGSVSNARLVTGGPEESIFQPEWSPEGVLHWVSDQTGWWNLYAERGAAVSALIQMRAELGLGQWQFGLSRYAFLSGGRIACLYSQNGFDYLGILEPGGSGLQTLDLPYNAFGSLRSDGREEIVFIAGSPSRSPEIVRVTVGEEKSRQVLRRSLEIDMDPAYISLPRSIEFPTEGNLTAFAFFYPPASPNFTAPESERPPLLVLCHGGPTSGSSPYLRLEIQYWTSRGFAVVDVNYGGSTGYGRAYRERLKGQWGVVDWADCVNAANYLGEAGKADGKRSAIRGSSAGGYTTLCSLVFSDTFAAGASYYGIAELTSLARETHKFESHYLESLIGPYPEAADLYRERSPIHFVDRLSCPVILFQGSEDAVVPPSQADQMVRALRNRRLPIAYLLFEGEQHGFRQAENIGRAIEAELYFYSRVFGFQPADEIGAVPIDNFEGLSG